LPGTLDKEPTMTSELELISDGDGIAVIGDPGDVELFLSSEGLTSRDLGLQRLGAGLRGGAGVAELGSVLAANSGRWVKLTEESAGAIKKYGLRESSRSGLSTGVIKGKGKGQIGGFVEFAKTPGAALTNPAVLAGAAGLMAQLAMQQTMDEITDYLAVIDAKLDDVLRAQRDSVLAQMIGVGLQIEEALTIHQHVGRVNEVTWSKVQAASGTIADTQAYALLQLDALADKLERKSTIADLMKTAQEAEARTRDWLAVLARCFQLQEGIAILELDRVLETAPEDLTGHRLGLQAARQDRLQTIAQSTDRLVTRIQTAAARANSKVLFNPIQSPAVVQASTSLTASVVDLHQRLGIGATHHSIETRGWGTAAADVRDRARTKGASALGASKRLGAESRGRATSTTSKVASRLGEAARRRRGRDGDVAAEEPEDD
jgi:hypothetical protein